MTLRSLSRHARQVYAIWDGTQETLCGDPYGMPEALTNDLLHYGNLN